jgi:hypothetical protein
MRFDHHSSLVTRRSSLIVAAALVAASVHAGLTFTIPAPNGIGDVVALTNALAQINALSGMANKNGSKVWLQPGVYDLAGITMYSDSHLHMDWHNCLLSGLGEGPADTVLLGAGAAENRRVIRCNGSNYGYCTISNLTVTGGYTSSSGGGIFSGNCSSRYFDCVVSNNFAADVGGGITRGQAINCLVADNTTAKNGGGLYTEKGTGLDARFFDGAWNCVFTNNVAEGGNSAGGAIYGTGAKCVGCTFVDNHASYGGAISLVGGEFKWNKDQFTNTTEVTDCVFKGNSPLAWGNGAAIYNRNKEMPPRLAVTGCEFIGNNDNDIGGYGVTFECDISNSVFRANYRQSYIVYHCNLTRCLVEDNTNNYSGLAIDVGSGHAYTNANCLFLRNMCLGGNGRVSQAKTLVNCNYINHSFAGYNYGAITTDCKLWNCIITGNKISGVARDVRAYLMDQTATLVLTNCLFTASDVAVVYPGLGNCQITSKFKFADAANDDYTPLTGSPCTDKGLQSDWILRLVGDRDLAGHRRVFGDGLDIGAFECQDIPPALRLIVR